MGGDGVGDRSRPWIVRALLQQSAGTIELADGIEGHGLGVTISLPTHGTTCGGAQSRTAS